MAFFSADFLSPLFSLTMAVLFAGTLYYLARLQNRVSAMRGAQSELRGLLRACSDSVDGAERSITAMRQSAQALAIDLGRTMDEAERLRAEVDRTCAAARQAMERLGPIAASVTAAPTPESAAPAKATKPGPAKPKPFADAALLKGAPVGSPQAPAGPHERAAMRLFRETFRGL
ncbi:DUF6468 domain-containing protein [Niveispirillum irakense]|uniref:DUF6468 domain-containing protein n=1 Tax=Niveispirillum irakense TaxID=34011 RepID=UPI0003FC827C|nr:DUF6468 domain-containing protein [Niveispirillum irakense]